MSENKFTNVPVEDETTIIAKTEGKIAGIDCRFEYWSWDGINGFSYIFLNDDIAQYSEDELTSLVAKEVLKHDNFSSTFKQIEKYTFLNIFYDEDDAPAIELTDEEKAEKKKRFLEYVKKHNESQS